MENLDVHIEAVLFYKTEPVPKRTLGKFFDVEDEEIGGALEVLRARLTGGVSLIETEEEVQLVTAPSTSETLEKLRKDELARDIGKAGAETLAIILYRGPIARGEIDLVRGVNSTFILRNLLIRGLVERIPHPKDKRQFQYRITPNLLAHLGITKKDELPEYQRIADELDTYERSAEDAEGEGQEERKQQRPQEEPAATLSNEQG